MNTPKLFKQTLAAAVAGAALSASVQAADEVNVAFFLEWATPNQVAKVEKGYDDALGVPVNWTNFDAGTQMTEAMLAGDIDISYSQGLAPFINAVNANAPIKLVAIAVQYPANDCVVRNGEGIDKSNATELEGKAVAVPLATMADYSFRMMMRALDVDVDRVDVIDQVPADAAVSLADGAVSMACGFGADSMAKMYEAGEPLMTLADKEAAGIISFDVISVTEQFAQENPDMVRTFLEVTDQANADFAADQSKIDVIAKDAGLSVESTQNQMAEFYFPSNAEQLEKYFNEGGLASVAIEVVGGAFATADNPALDDYSAVVDTSFLQ
ncbi:MAG: ABC transporter substrate-binding protein [Gammaproteobacteria bacterium]|nr:ABC transporter substrate-binding protein [Gammaproteobacteria bacterium]MDE0715308.1 ABC transporter substrate-binding protein [Gammaproteobacteria bacterium]MYH91363.1 taurine ABC transporter substrate-binding protein [Gammaproteobacteria bacterium]